MTPNKAIYQALQEPDHSELIELMQRAPGQDECVDIATRFMEEMRDMILAIPGVEDTIMKAIPNDYRWDDLDDHPDKGSLVYQYVWDMMNTCDNTLHKIKAWRDISDIHQEVPGYEHCVEVTFDRDFWNDEQKEAMQQSARDLCREEVGEIPDADQLGENLDFDWRDDREVWVRFNDVPYKETP